MAFRPPDTGQIAHLMVGNSKLCDDLSSFGMGYCWAARTRVTCDRCCVLIAIAEANGIPFPESDREWEPLVNKTLREQIEACLDR
jgi:hypothetical protein